MVRLGESYSSPAPNLGRDSADSAVFDHDFRALEWQQLANSSAIKQELLKHTRLVASSPQIHAGDVREKVRLATNRPGGRITSSQKADWMQRILNEEQRKPLKVSEQFVRCFTEREDEIAERRAYDIKRFRQSCKKMNAERKHNEDQRDAAAKAKEFRDAVALREKARAAGLPFEDDDPLFATTKLSSDDGEERQGEQHEEEEEEEIGNRALKGWSKGGPDWDKPVKTGGITPFRQKAPDIQFVKRRTPATGSTPSQIVYAVRVEPHVRAMSAPPDLGPEGVPPRTIRRKKKNKDQGPQLSEWEIKLQNARLEKEQKRRDEEEQTRYQDQVIRQWLREKSEEEQKRERRQQKLKLKEKKRMELDRQRIMAIEEELQSQENAQSDIRRAEPEAAPPMPKAQLSTSQYLQRQRQLLLEDYLRKHMSLPLQARSPVLAGLQQLGPARPPRAMSADGSSQDGQEAGGSLTGRSTPLPAISQIMEPSEEPPAAEEQFEQPAES